MSKRPFMQLYVSDFLGDTLDLNTEGIGAYMLLLMAMWNAGGSLPDNDAKLARITRLSVKRWRAVATDLLSYFERDKGRITHQRLSKEFQKSESKSQSRAAAGSSGGKAKALKDHNAVLAIANVLPQHLPETRSQKELEPIAQRTVPAPPRNRWDELQSKLLEAAGMAGFRDERNPKLANLAPVRGLMEQGYSLEADILPAIRDKAAEGVKFQSWAYIVPVVVERAAAKTTIPQKPTAQGEDWAGRLQVWNESQTWSPGWGPNPGEPKCRAPVDLLPAGHTLPETRRPP